MCILALSLGVVWGYGGILCFGQSAFFGLGAYTYAVTAVNLGESTLAIVLSVVVPAVFAALLGYFMFYGRLSDVYLGRHHAERDAHLLQPDEQHRGRRLSHRHRAAERLQRHALAAHLQRAGRIPGACWIRPRRSTSSWRCC